MLKPLLYAISIREVEEDEPVESECHDQQGNLARIHRQTYTRGRVAGDVDQHFGNQRPGIEHRDPPDLPVAEQPHEPNHRRHAKIEEQIGRHKIVQCLRIQVRFPIDDRIFRHRVLLCYFLDLLLSGFLLALASRQFQKVADIVREPDRWRRLWETEENEKDDGANAGPAKVVPGKKPNAKRSVVLRGCRGAQLWYAQLLQPLIELRLNVRRLNRFFLVYVGGGFPLVNRFGHIYLRLAGHHDSQLRASLCLRAVAKPFWGPAAPRPMLALPRQHLRDNGRQIAPGLTPRRSIRKRTSIRAGTRRV